MSWAVLAAAVVLLIFAAALRAAGASLVRTPRADALRDGAEGDADALRIAELLDDRARLQPAMGVVHSTLIVVAAVSSAWAITDLFDGWLQLAGLIGVGLVIAIFGDVLPRTWGRSRPRTLAYRFAGLLGLAVSIGDRAADLAADDEDDEDVEAEDEVDQEERELISSVLEFTDTIVREVMVPRPDMITIASTVSTDKALALVVAEGRSRIPVTGEGQDDVVGIFYARDLLGLMDRNKPSRPVSELMAPAYLVPETKRLSELLREMQSNQAHMAIVVDEFGGVAGLCTIEDILEELVGEIADEYDVEEPMVVQLDNGSYRVDGRLAVDELEQLLGLELPDEEWDTVGGLVLGLAGRVPKEGESFELDGIVIQAERVQGRRVAEVSITRK